MLFGVICCGDDEPFFLQSKELESLQHNLPHLQGVEEGHQPLVFLPRPDRPWFNYVADRHCLGLHLKVDFGVDVGGIDRGMAKPCADRIDIHASKDQVAGSCMSQHMRRYFSPFQRRHTRCATPDKPIDSEPGERFPESAEEDRITGCTTFNQLRQDLFGLWL